MKFRVDTERASNGPTPDRTIATIKVKLRTYTTFKADFADDAEFAEGGDIKRPGGLGIARVLYQMLESRGFKVSQPEQHGFYGWAFVVCDEDLVVWFHRRCCSSQSSVKKYRASNGQCLR